MSNPSGRSEHYGMKAFKKSFAHFILGKGFSAIATICVLFIIIRELSIEEFAVYSSLHALVFIIGKLSSFGVNPVLLRYLPELKTQNQNKPMYRLLVLGLLIRALSYALFILILIPFIENIAGVFKLDNWLWLVPWYFIVGFFRVNTTFFSQALESLLWQRDAQYSLAIAGFIRLLGVIVVLYWYDLTLFNFVIVELVAEISSYLLQVMFSISRWRKDADRRRGNENCLMENRSRYLKFAYWCYLQNTTSILYGSAPNRLFASFFLPIEYIAMFGVIDRLIDFVRRYEPLRMFQGMVRPVFMSRYSEDGNFAHLASMANFLIRFNLIFLLLPFLVLSIMGDVFFAWVTDGKYTDITALFLGFYLVVLVNSMNYVFDMFAKAVERNKILPFSNLVLSLSIVSAIPLIHHIGLWSIAIANVLGLVVSLLIVSKYLKKQGFIFTFEWLLTFKVIVYMVLSLLTGYLLLINGVNVFVTTVISCLLYTGLIILKPPVNLYERNLLKKLLSSKIHKV